MTTIITPEKQGFRDFDLPKEHLLDIRHHVPARAHDPAEIARRRELSPGTLITEQQRSGLIVARKIMDIVTEEEARIFSYTMLSIAGLNTAWYSYAQNSDVMRRRLKLPIMKHARNHNPDLLVEDVKDALDAQVERATQLVIATDLQLHSEAMHQRRLGVGVGNLALKLGMYEPVLMGAFESDPELTDVEAQMRVRSRTLRLLSRARTMHREVGAHPSIAQLSDPYSHFAVYWHRKAPSGAQSAVNFALS